MHPPEKQNPRQDDEGHPAGAKQSNFGSIQSPEFPSIARQAQHLQRLYLLSFDAARTVAELAFAGLPR